MQTHKIKTVRISALKPAPYNPRQISKEALAGLAHSLKRFGLVQPIIINKGGRVIGGHQRLKALQAAGERETQVIEVDLKPSDEKALNVTLNNPSISGEFTDGLQEILDELQKSIPGDFIDLRLDELVGDLTNTGNTDPDDAPPLPKKAKTKMGDLYQLGEHRLLCGDSLDLAQIKHLIGSDTIDMVFTDPPYGINAVKISSTKRLGSIGGSKAFGAVGRGGRRGAMYPFGGVKNMLGRVHGPARKAIIRPNLYAPVIGDNSTKTAIASYLICASLKIKTLIFWGGNYYADKLPPSRCWIVWDKENTGTFADGELAWTNIDAPLRIFRHMWSGLMKASERGQARIHPTQKPVALANFCITEFGDDSKVVMDLFGGSGSTLIACEQIKRRCLMMERSEAYCDVIRERWEKFTGSKSKKA